MQTVTDLDEPTQNDHVPPEGPAGTALAPIGRIFGYLIIWWIGMSIASSLVFPFVSDRKPTDLTFLAVVAIPNAMATILLTLAFVKYMDQRPVMTLGLSRQGSWMAELGFGVLLGPALVGIVFLTALALGWVDITGSLFLRSPATIALALLQTLVVMAGIAVTEEVAVRGYILQNLRDGYGAVAALVVSSLLFGVLHLMNPEADLSALGGTLAAGLILGYGYLATERLWLPIGFHFSWNFALGPIFGFPVSGIDLPAWLMHNPSGPVVWTGGAFGPEAGVLGIIAMALGWLGIRYFRRLWYRPGQAALETGAESPDNKMQDESRVA